MRKTKSGRILKGKRFIQMVVAPWQGDNNRTTYTLFALSADGQVFALRAGIGWIEVQHEIDQRNGVEVFDPDDGV